MRYDTPLNSQKPPSFAVQTPYFSQMKHPRAKQVGANAHRNSRHGETPSGNQGERIDWPAGFGALAITVRPPPTKAPATTACRKASAAGPATDKAVASKAPSPIRPRIGEIHQP